MELSWESLRPELLELILESLSLPDYLRFSAVCSSWSRVQCDYRHRCNSVTHQMPWLMLPDNQDSPQWKNFYSPTEQRYYRVPLALAAQGKQFRGTSRGWLLFLDEKSLVFVNPCTGSVIQIPIPPPMLGKKFIYLGGLSSSLTDPDCIILLRAFDDCECYFYCNIMDQEWKTWAKLPDISHSVPSLPTAISICGGKLYIDGGRSKLIVMEPFSHHDVVDLPSSNSNMNMKLIMSDQLVRQYSLCSSPSNPQSWRIGVLLDPSTRGGSAFVHDRLHEGVKARVRGPRNHFVLHPSSRYQFIAGGIGVTPILPMIEAAEAAGADWQLLYGGRQRASMGFLPELEQYGDRVTVWPQDENGLLDLQATLGEARDDTLVYCCGPGPLLDAVEAACTHWPTGALHIERFTAKEISSDDVEGALEHFTVECKRSGITLEIGPHDSILDVLRDNGVSMLSSCSEGILVYIWWLSNFQVNS